MLGIERDEREGGRMGCLGGEDETRQARINICKTT